MSASPGPSTDATAVAALYDWEHDEFDDDIDFYLSLAKRAGGPILELACGSGRLLQPLAEMGVEVVGVDYSDAMLDRARARLTAAGLRAHLKRMDMTRDLPSGPFTVVMLALNAFGFAQELDDQVRLLERIHARLEPGGVVVLDLAHPATLSDPPNGVQVLQRSGWCEELSADVVKWMVQEISISEQRLDLSCFYDLTAADGTFRRVSDRVRMRYFSRFEAELLCLRAGLEVASVFGSYELEPLTDGSDRMILIGSRP